jgi:SAM-dependent methyltransferase
MTRDNVKVSYDSLAAEYAARIFGELDGKPIDRALLTELAHRSEGPVCDLGCGPGHVTRFLSEQGAKALGVDLSARMVEEARRLNPGLPFAIADMLALPFTGGALGAVVAMYSMIHFEEGPIALAAAEIVRVLAPKGFLLAAFHRGYETRQISEMWSVKVDLDFHFFEPSEIVSVFSEAGLNVERVVERGPYTGVEVDTQRFYIFAVA